MYSNDGLNIGPFFTFQASGYGGTTQVGHDTDKIAEMEPKKERKIKVMFNADTAATMRWNFRPQQVNILHILKFHFNTLVLVFYLRGKTCFKQFCIEVK